MTVVRSEFQIKNRYYRKVKPLLRLQRLQHQMPSEHLYNIDQYLAHNEYSSPVIPMAPLEPRPEDGFFNSQILNLNLKIS